MDSAVKYLEGVRRRSLELGIPAIDPEDGIVLQSMAFYTASLGLRLAVDAGAGIGYSTAWIALGMEAACKGDCTIIAIEYDEVKASMISKVLAPLGLERVKVEVVAGEALDILRGTQNGSIGLVFIDVEKNQYPEALDTLSDKLHPRGVALFHNAYFPPPPRSFFKKVNEPPWRSTIAPTPAGLLIATLDRNA